MTLRAPWQSVAIVVVLVLAGFAHAAVKDAAELLPAQTLACVEVRQPERLSREIALLLKGSKLEDMPAVMARFHENLGDNNPFWMYSVYAASSLLVSPEMINECGRIQGGIVAVTGVTKDGPEVVGVILAGDSNLPTFYMRAMLTADFNVRTVAEVEGVRIYREHSQIFRAPIAGAAPMPPQQEDHGPFMALLPSTIILGSSVESVQDVVRRFKGKSSEPSLASVAAYKEAAKQRDKPGFFAYTDLAALAGRMDELGQNLGSFGEQWRVVKATVNPKAVLSATASLTLQNGVLELKSRVDLDPKQSSPLADLMTAKAATPDVLHFTPRDGLLTLSLNLNDGEKRWDKLLGLIDGLTKSPPGGAERPTASAGIHELEERVKLNIAKDVLGKLTSAAVTLDPEAAMRPDGHVVPLLVLQANDAAAAESLEKQALLKLLGLATGVVPAAISEKGDGNIRTVAAGGLEGVLHTKNLYIGREGAFLAVGPDRKEVAAALNVGAKKEGLLGEEKTVAALKGLEDSAAVAVFSSAKEIVDLFKQMERAPSVMAAPPFAKVAVPAPRPLAPPPGLNPNDKPADDKPPRLSKRAEKTIADAVKAVESLPPTVLSLSHKADGLTLEIRQSGLRNTTSRLIDLLIDATLERLLEQQKPNAN
ncbi:MAG TPA: hypothetical protein DDY78_02040 [Planctomycetales bacterium]|jgi:hypothetical protein|nr:hypothetical protein [Planctomycetales bacterium]